MFESKPTLNTFIPEKKLYLDASGNPREAELFVWQELRNPYDVLALPTNANKDQIKARYRELVKNTHPDTSTPDPERIIQINKAYELLSNDTLKAVVDSTINGPLQKATTEKAREKAPSFNHPKLQQQFDLFRSVKTLLIEEFHQKKVKLENYNNVFRGIQIESRKLFLEALSDAKDLNTLFSDQTIESFLSEGFLSPYDYNEFRLRYMDKRQQLEDDKKLHTLAAKFSGESTQA